MAYGDSLGLTLPVVGTDQFPAAATNVGEILAALIAVVEQPVRPASIDINANLSFKPAATAYAATGLKYVQLTPGANLTAVAAPAALFCKSADGEVYLNDNNGNQIQLTDAGALNVASVGGITGSGYGSGSVEVNWDSGSTAYRMRKGAGTHDFANIVVNKVRFDDGSSNEVTLQPANIAADYTLTLPTPPGSGSSLLQLASTGIITASDALTPTGGTLAITGAITASTSVTAASLRYTTDDEVFMPACAGQSDGTFAFATGHWVLTAGQGVMFPIVVPSGTRITGYRAYGESSDGNGEFTVSLLTRDLQTDTIAGVGSTQTSGTVDETYYTPGQSGLTPEVTDGSQVYMIFVLQSNGTEVKITGASFECDRP